MQSRCPNRKISMGAESSTRVGYLNGAQFQTPDYFSEKPSVAQIAAQILSIHLGLIEMYLRANCSFQT
jgi:hypothetical protein